MLSGVASRQETTNADYEVVGKVILGPASENFKLPMCIRRTVTSLSSTCGGWEGEPRTVLALWSSCIEPQHCYPEAPRSLRADGPMQFARPETSLFLFRFQFCDLILCDLLKLGFVLGVVGIAR